MIYKGMSTVSIVSDKLHAGGLKGLFIRVLHAFQSFLDESGIFPVRVTHKAYAARHAGNGN